MKKITKTRVNQLAKEFKMMLNNQHGLFIQLLQNKNDETDLQFELTTGCQFEEYNTVLSHQITDEDYDWKLYQIKDLIIDRIKYFESLKPINK